MFPSLNAPSEDVSAVYMRSLEPVKLKSWSERIGISLWFNVWNTLLVGICTTALIAAAWYVEIPLIKYPLLILITVVYLWVMQLAVTVGRRHEEDKLMVAEAEVINNNAFGGSAETLERSLGIARSLMWDRRRYTRNPRALL